MHNFRQLKIWQESMELVKEILICTNGFPKERKFGITSQINRAAVSIPSNIAEGSARTTNKDFSRFLSIALGSAFELETQLILSESLDLISKEKSEIIINELVELQRMITGFKKSLS